MNFSIAQQATAGQGHRLTGTPAYMAPELWGDGEMTPASEQFALAAIAYYLVTGARPFEGQENPDVRRRNFRHGPPPAHEEAADNGQPVIPRAISQVLATALATDPAKRYDAVSAFADAFRLALRRIVHKTEGPDVFISYQRKSSAMLANLLAEKLGGKGIRAFVDTQRLDGAGPFPPHIERAIEDTDVFICLLAKATLQAPFVLEEIRVAHRYGKPMIPIMQESFEPKTQESDSAIATLLENQGLFVFDERNLNVDHTVTDLARLIRSAIDQRDRR